MRLWKTSRSEILAEAVPGTFLLLRAGNIAWVRASREGEFRGVGRVRCEYSVEEERLRCATALWNGREFVPTRLKEWDWGVLLENLQPLPPSEAPDPEVVGQAFLAWRNAQAESLRKNSEERRSFLATLPALEDRTEISFAFEYGSDGEIIIRVAGGPVLWRESPRVGPGRECFENAEQILREKYGGRFRSFQADLRGEADLLRFETD